MNLIRSLRLWLTVCILASTAGAYAQTLPGPDPDNGQTFRVLTFHDVRKNVRESFATDPDAYAIDENSLLTTFSWLRTAGYHPVSLSQIVAAREGKAPLPSQPVLLTFDDGYESAYSIVYPLLKRFNYPAVFALVTEWMNVPAGQQVTDFAATPVPREHFMSWDQATEMARSGLVELAGHTNTLHGGVVANPQGNLLPAVTTHVYDPAAGKYETDAQYMERITNDLRENKRQIEQHTGAHVRAIVWPYGAYNQDAVEAAGQAGLPITLSLDDGPNTPDVPLNQLRRGLVSYDVEGPQLLSDLRATVLANDVVRHQSNRVMHVDLDYIYDPDPAQQERNLSHLLDRVQAIRPASVFLQAYADPDGDGVADALYFPNRHMPMRADLFSRVAWQLRTRDAVRVYAWMPVSAFKLPAGDPAADKVVQTMPGAPEEAKDGYHRLSVFDAGARQAIVDIYDDLGRYAAFSGVLYHDDGMFNDYEDASPAALHTYQQWGLPADVAAIRADPKLAAQWMQDKTQYLIAFTNQLTATLRRWQPTLLTARNMYAGPLLDPSSEAWFAQNYAAFLKNYDFTAIEAMPYMENAAKPDDWLADLARRAAQIPGALDRTVFELQARDWKTGKPVPDKTLESQFMLLRRLGVRHLGYYPDDFLDDQPGQDMLKRQLSTQTELGNDYLKDPINTPASLGGAGPSSANQKKSGDR